MSEQANKPGSDLAPEPAEAGVEPARPEGETADSRAPKEIGGRDGPEPTRFGDWEKNGRCIDF